MKCTKFTLAILCTTLANFNAAIANSAAETAQAEVDQLDEVDFNRHIRPILSNNCFFCHGPDPKTREGDLRLDIREDAIEAFAFIPGDTEDGELLHRIFSDDPDEVMPEPSSNKSLTEQEKLLLKRWIAEGAEYESHWSYTPVKKPKHRGIDNIVSKELAQRGLTFSKEANKETLIRRVYLDLIGLPPSPEEVAAFLNDRSSKAYEKVVDRLLASKHYGERMAIPWLDAVRYADTVGYHGDQERDATPYRDYVIESFNNNKPYDQFTIEQIAGDLLPNPTIKQLVASSYNRINQLSREGGIQDKEYVKKYQAERVRTTATTFLGSTLACAECHDHKFDPFTTKDFYSMAAFFADILEKGAYTGDGSYQEDPEPYFKDGISQEGWFGPELTVPNRLLHPDPESVEREIDRRESILAQGSPEAEAEFEDWLAMQAQLADSSEPNLVALDYTNEHHESTKTESIELTHLTISADSVAALSFQARVVGGGGRSSFGIELTYEAAGETYKRLYYWGNNYDGELDNKTDAPWRIQMSPDLYRGIWHSIELTADDFQLPKNAQFVQLLPLKGTNSSFRNFEYRTHKWGTQRGTLSEQGISHLNHVLAGKASRRIHKQLKEEFFVSLASTFAPDRNAIEELKQELEGNRYTPLTISAKPREVKVLPRGNWMDESGETVLPASPGFLPNPIESSADRRLNRLDLANWIVDEGNPLTARTFVNRIWAMYFGTPLSSAAEDLGLQGEYPPYPELLDWLAADFMDAAWNIKHLVKTIVMSRTYRQTSHTSEDLLELDPYNRLLARQSPRRLPAEVIRDNALKIGGLLNTKIGGKSARPYQPAGYYRNLNFPKREYEADTDENQFRRGVYMHWQRTFLHPMLSSFDASSRDECTVKRDLSNTPLQALNLLNDPTQVEAARGLAERLIIETSDEKRVTTAYLKALSRSPSPEEIELLTDFLERERTRFRQETNIANSFLLTGIRLPGTEHDSIELAALTSMSRAILNLHETITRY